MQLSSKTFLVTGGTDGIGRELVRQLRAKGATIITHGRTEERVAAVRAEGFEVIAADLSTTEGVETLLDAVKGRAIDGLVNNAGCGTFHDLLSAEGTDNAADAQCIALNLTAPIRLIVSLLPVLLTRPEAMIVNVTSGLAIAPATGAPVYCATKAGLRSYTLALRHQLKQTHVHVLEALPPLVDTKMGKGDGVKKMPPAECARQIIRAMERGADEANIGIVKLLRAVYSFSPAFVRRVMLTF